MPYALFTFLLLISVGHLPAQYFQQQTDYKIEARLDDEKHELHAHLELTYTNNAPGALEVIYFHLWPRAYGSDATAFAKQQLRDGNTRFHFSDLAQRGTLDSLDFRTNDQALEWSFDPQHRDIAKVKLAAPLKSGATIIITTPFRVKIPASFSRLGHVGQSYQMTQWYPKPAVYDQEGWHAMPYLDRGEFFSEFGTFDVSITLPKNYIVGATGTLENTAECERLLALAAATQTELAQRADLSESYVVEDFPPSAVASKTLRYRAERVHDFAWFADKRFKVLHDTLQLPGRETTVDIWSFFTETEAAYWKNSLLYLKRSTAYYSAKVGTYPYPQVTGVQSALSAGGGMEYPMITVIGRNFSEVDLDEVLTHEVGHNWFYGVLASNERTHPWMDEGFNSYYEARYMQEYYPGRNDGFSIYGMEVDIAALGYRYQQRRGAGQSPDMDSDSMSANNYWLNVYSKPAMALDHLAMVYGTASVDQAMQAYFREWQFRHPSPGEVKKTFESSLGKPLGWLFDGFLRSAEVVDFSLETGDAGRLLVKRKGGLQVPVVAVPTDQRAVGKEIITEIPPEGYLLPAGDYALMAGPLDLSPGNNLVKRPLKLRLAIGPESSDGYQQIFATPLIGYNAHNGIMAGAALHNRTLEPKRLEFLLAPMYGFESGSVNGFAGLQWRPNYGSPNLISLGVQRFASNDFEDLSLHYQRLGGSFTHRFYHAPITEVTSSLALSLTGLWNQRPEFDREGVLLGKTTIASQFARLDYTRTAEREINSFGLKLGLEYGRPTGFLESDFLKLDLELTGGYQFSAEKFIRWRLFAGYFVSNDLRDRNFSPGYAFSLIDNAATDYDNRDLYLGRGETGFYEQQLGLREGGFRTPISAAFGFGRSNNYLTALNLDAHLPFTPSGFPLGVFLDAGNYGRSPLRADSESAFQWAGGLSLTFLEGKAGLYAPLVASPELKNLLLQRGNILERLSFRLSLTELLPWKWLDKVEL